MPERNVAVAARLSTALALAGTALAAVGRGKALDDALAATGAKAAPAERAAAQDIAYSACRRLNQLDALAALLVARPNPAFDALLRTALSELIEHPERAHVVVSEAVNAAAAAHGGAFKGVVNAVLRRFLREREVLMARVMASESCRLAHPDWWIARLRRAWPDDAQAILAASLERASMTLRVNRRRCDVAAYQARLAATGIEAETLAGGAIRLVRPRPARELPGFSEGDVSVQDLGAQIAAPLLAPADGMRVLDACAAPGGKTAHLLELADCEVMALDRDAKRLGAVETNLRRLGLSATLKAADAADLGTWWDGRPFDRVLLDAPCTASGVIRRHPDGKWLKRESDIASLAATQARLLAALWQVLRPGGKLLYATCSVFPDENASQSAAFLNARPDAQRLPPDLPVAHRDGQLFPCADHDGFYFALFEKHR